MKIDLLSNRRFVAAMQNRIEGRLVPRISKCYSDNLYQFSSAL
jgi:hypothetical protein